MNLDLLSTVLHTLTSGSQSETPLTAVLNLTDVLEQGLTLKSGQSVQLNLNTDGSLLVLSGQNTSEEGIILKPQSLMLDNSVPQKGEPLQIEAKVLNMQNNSVKLQIVSLNKMPPQQYIRTQSSSAAIQLSPEPEMIIKDTSGASGLSFAETNIMSVAEPYINRQPLPATLKDALRQIFSQIGIKVELKHLETVPHTEASAGMTKTAPTSSTVAALTAEIAQITGDAAAKLSAATQTTLPDIIQQTIQSLKSSLQDLKGLTLPALTATDAAGRMVFSSVLGNLRPELNVQLPENLAADLHIADIIIYEAKSDIHSSITPQDIIRQSLQKLQNAQPELYNKIIAKMPSSGEKMLSNMVSFVKAAAKGDIRQWLGADLTAELENRGVEGQKTLNELQSALQSSNRQTPAWRIIDIPYYAENYIAKIRLAVKQYPDDEDDDSHPQRKFGTRFVVDTNFTRLGAFQFDGFSFAKDRRFDLIIRTEREIDNDLCAEIVRIFKTTLHDVQYVGGIKINLKENFIKISENKTKDNFLSQDLFV